MTFVPLFWFFCFFWHFWRFSKKKFSPKFRPLQEQRWITIALALIDWSWLGLTRFQQGLTSPNEVSRELEEGGNNTGEGVSNSSNTAPKQLQLVLIDLSRDHKPIQTPTLSLPPISTVLHPSLYSCLGKPKRKNSRLGFATCANKIRFQKVYTSMCNFGLWKLGVCNFGLYNKVSD